MCMGLISILRVSIQNSTCVADPLTRATEIIPKFSSLLTQSLPLILHGSGLNTRRYLFASDAADAFDTILHNGVVGEIYKRGLNG